MIYHITTAVAWQAAQLAGVYTADSLQLEGFIHFSRVTQLPRVAAKFYRGQTGLVLITVDPARLSAELRDEEGEPGEQFPHLYGPLNLDAVVTVEPFLPPQ
ncbi:MAG: DUF952 domain-containing protein [Oscillochloridaceae bacterium umkhey_bin13]